MSHGSALVCSGAPRDLGLDQGLHFRELIRAEVARRVPTRGRPRVWGGRRDPEVDRALRDTRRFFPHMAERAEGIASGARISSADVAALLSSESAAAAPTLIGVTREASGGATWIALSSGREAPLFLRQSRPENGYRSLEVGIPWRVAALAGVNEHGLAVAATALASPAVSPVGCAAPAVLLVQDCLQRFDSVEKAVDWCERRPARGDASILLADAGGELARVDLEGDRRQLHRDVDGVLLGGGEPARSASLEKACRARDELDAEALREVLSNCGGRGVVLSPEEPERIYGDVS
jgi:hypothetical protein